jgi:hypothetical protein
MSMMLDLIEQYNALSDKEKKALLIYKSQLGLFINQISDLITLDGTDIFNNLSDKTTFYQKYLQYKAIIEKTNNTFIRYSLFSNIDFTNIYAFINSLKQVYLTLITLKDKIVTKDNLTLYRSYSINKQDQEFTLAPHNLVSTSLNINVCDKFIIPNLNPVLDIITIPEGTSVLVTPYSIGYKINTDTLSIIKNDQQEEVVLYQDTLKIENIQRKIKDGLIIYHIDMVPKKQLNNIKR